MRIDIPVGLQLLFGTSLLAAVEEDSTDGLVTEAFDDLDEVCADVVLLPGCPQSCMPSPVECRLEVYEDMVEVLRVLEISLTVNASVENMLCDAPSCSVACLFFSDDLLRLWFQSVQYDLQHDFAWVTDEAYCSVVLALLQVAFLGECDDKDWVHEVGHSPVC